MQAQLNNRGKCMCSWWVNTNNIDKIWIPIKQIGVNQISCTFKRENRRQPHNQQLKIAKYLIGQNNKQELH